MVKQNTLKDHLKREINELRRHYPVLKDEDLFLVWFLRAYVTEDLNLAAKAVTNGPKDKGIDAIFIDDSSRSIFVVQSKYRYSLKSKNESRQDVLGLAHLANILLDSEKKNFNNLLEGADPGVIGKLIEARKRLARSGYRLWMYYATMGKCSLGLRKEAESVVRSDVAAVYIEILDGRRLDILMRDYMDGVAPPIPSLDLLMESGQGITVNGILQRYDAHSKIESWVFSMQGDSIGSLYETGGKRLFARNIRGFLGEITPVNRSMEYTLRDEAERFFYYNNGITIICDDAKKVSARGRDVLRVSNPQIINGQQTTRTLASKTAEAKKASVLVRVIQVPRGAPSDQDEFDVLVSQIVEGANWQNAIRPSDLVANDRRQVELQREFRKRGYLYLRKRESKGEAKRAAETKQFILIKKEDLARAVAGCDLDPVEPRSGVENLFDEDKYSSIFPNSDPCYYLLRYWTMNQVTNAAKGYPQRGYAKWLVLGFVWLRLSPVLRSSMQEKFIYQIERGNIRLKKHLLHAINIAFTSALNYWRKNRGSGATMTDISTFFRNKRGRHKEFQSFWRGKHNNGRKGFEIELKMIKQTLKTS